jgi:hypothetical protein
MADWFVRGPFEVPVDTLRSGGHFVDCTKFEELAEESDEFLKPGIYVFGLRSRGTVPIYVGMTQSTSLIREAFTPDKLHKVNTYINNHPHGTLVIYLITQIGRGRGRPNLSDIERIEWWLIGLAEQRNENLINSRTPGKEPWRIKGVHNGGRGKRTQDEDAFRDMMGIKSESRPTASKGSNPNQLDVDVATSTDTA